MSRDDSVQNPYSELGRKLKLYRERRKRSITEASGAVEIEPVSLESIEKGEQRPEEEILSLLISYFEIEEEYASKLYRLAGYTETASDSSDQGSLDLAQPIAMLMPVDLRVVYTDTAHVMVNNYGVVMNFMQTNGTGSQPLAVSRVGMSKDHAKSLIKMLQQSIKQAEKQESSNKTSAKKKTQDPKKSDASS
jgi:DNA-binding XRE family transcriptional regulator